MKRATIARMEDPVFSVDESLTREEQIAQRVQELWQLREFGCWNDTDTWVQAEREINEWHQKCLQPDHGLLDVCIGLKRSAVAKRLRILVRKTPRPLRRFSRRLRRPE